MSWNDGDGTEIYYMNWLWADSHNRNMLYEINVWEITVTSHGIEIYYMNWLWATIRWTWGKTLHSALMKQEYAIWINLCEISVTCLTALLGPSHLMPEFCAAATIRWTCGKTLPSAWCNRNMPQIGNMPFGVRLPPYHHVAHNVPGHNTNPPKQRSGRSN